MLPLSVNIINKNFSVSTGIIWAECQEVIARITGRLDGLIVSRWLKAGTLFLLFASNFLRGYCLGFLNATCSCDFTWQDVRQ